MRIGETMLLFQFQSKSAPKPAGKAALDASAAYRYEKAWLTPEEKAMWGLMLSAFSGAIEKSPGRKKELEGVMRSAGELACMKESDWHKAISSLAQKAAIELSLARAGASGEAEKRELALKISTLLFYSHFTVAERYADHAREEYGNADLVGNSNFFKSSRSYAQKALEEYMEAQKTAPFGKKAEIDRRMKGLRIYLQPRL